MPYLRKLQFSQGPFGWSPVHSGLPTKRDLERSALEKEKVSRDYCFPREWGTGPAFEQPFSGVSWYYLSVCGSAHVCVTLPSA